MATTATPYGLKPVNLVGGLPYAGSARQYLIDSAGYATNIFNGSIVTINASGFINIVGTTGADASSNVFPAGTIGVFVGCDYINSLGQLTFSQHYPASTTGVVHAYVVDDDRVVFQAQCDSAVVQAELGANTYLAAAQSTSTGSTTTGNSTSALVGVSVTTTAAFRIVGFVDSPASAVGDAYTDVLVKFNPGYHSYSNAVGI